MFPEFLYNIYYKFSIVFREKNGSFSHEQTRLIKLSFYWEISHKTKKKFLVKIQRCAIFLLDNVDHVQENITILVRTAHGRSRGLSDESEWSVSEQLRVFTSNALNNMATE